MSTDLMIDIETLSTKPNALVLSIGMCWFDRAHPDDEVIALPIIYPTLSQEDSHIDPQTVRWWMKQTDSARGVFDDIVEDKRISCTDAAIDVGEAVNNADRIWAKDPDFDCVILSHFVNQQVNFDWPFWKNRSVRTMLDTVPVAKNMEFEGTQHDALADAVHQAKQMQLCYTILKSR